MDRPDASRPLSHQGFFKDLESALAVWLRFPLLPLLSLTIVVGAQVAGTSPAAFVLSTGLLLVSVTWPGVERSWYRAAWRRESVKAADVMGWLMTHFWPFFRLGLLITIVLAPIVLVTAAVASGSGGAEGRGAVPVLRFALIGVSLVIDLALTFVTPALAYRTERVRSALRLGLAIIAASWPRSLAYVLVPPFAIQLFFFVTAGRTVHPVTLIVVGATTTLANLAFKGAVAKFYLRSEHLVIDLEERDRAATEGPSPHAR